MYPNRMVHQTVKLMHKSRVPGDLLMHAPDYSWEELMQFAANRDAWRTLVATVKGSRVHVDMRQYAKMRKVL